MTNGFLRIASVAPLHRVADIEYNISQILNCARQLEQEQVEIAVFPELSITGYTCGDLFHSSTLLDASLNALELLAKETAEMNLHLIVGLPRRKGNAIMNSAALLRNGKIDFIDKTYIPNYNEFYEKRWFASATPDNNQVFESHGVQIGIEICEDLWVPIPPSCHLAMKGAQVIFNLSASDDIIGKHAYLTSLIKQQSGRCICAYAYSSAGFGESTTDLVFLPKTIICENGSMLTENNHEDYLRTHITIADIDIDAINHDRAHNISFNDCALRENDTYESLYSPMTYDIAQIPKYRNIDAHPFVPKSDAKISERCREITTIQECGLTSRLYAIGQPKVVVGISGGLDSTLALLVAAASMKRLKRPMTDIIAITMPGFGTSGRTYSNALSLMTLLGVTQREISIADAVNKHFSDINHDASVHDVTYENSQARERTQILMDVANQVGGIVLGTGDLSELALGWATYNGDHMSMYGVNASVPKTLVKFLVRHYAMASENTELKDVLLDIIDTPISPELTPLDDKGCIAQKTESFVGPYELNDFFLYYTLRYGYSPTKIFILSQKAFAKTYDNKELIKWMDLFYRRFFTQQFKRSCLPDGPKVGSVCLSPRGDWRMPSDASTSLWLSEVKAIEANI